jgi:hypothetical protein
MPNYWLTICVTTDDHPHANMLAEKAAAHCGGHVLQVDHEPPQGSLVVGDHWDREDGR